MDKSKNILITGASTGIGYDLAKTFLAAGYVVYGSVRNQADAARLREELGSDFHALVFDVTNYKAVEDAADKLIEKLGSEGLGALINNAGIAVGGPFVDLDVEDFKHQFDVNVFGLIKVTQAFLPLLGARENHSTQPGRIIQISSVSGKIAAPFVSAYVGSKHAVEGISHSLRRELQNFGIDVIIIGPGPVKTPIWNKGVGAQGKLFEQSIYKSQLNEYKSKMIKKSLRGALTSESVAKDILRIFETKKPKTRYTLVASRLKFWHIPRWMPDRMLDRFFKKILKL